MPIPNADRAIIAVEKQTAYLLNPLHKRGGAKARLLLGLGYRSEASDALESDLRTQHLALDAVRVSKTSMAWPTRSMARSRPRRTGLPSAHSARSLLA